LRLYPRAFQGLAAGMTGNFDEALRIMEPVEAELIVRGGRQGTLGMSTRAVLAFYYLLSGQLSRGEQYAQELFGYGESDLVLHSFAAMFLLQLYLRRGQSDEAQRLLDQWCPRVPTQPPTRLSWTVWTGQHEHDVHHGRYRQVIDQLWQRTPLLRTVLFDHLSEWLWYQPLLDATAVLFKRGAAGRSELRRARRIARRLTRRLPSHLKSVGHLAHGLLLVSRNDHHSAKAHVELAVQLSSEYPQTWERYRCLWVAQQLGCGNDELAKELRKLARKQGYATPKPLSDLFDS